MTAREKWVEQWKAHVTGLALTGLVETHDEKPKGPHMAGQRALELPAKVEKLLASMYDTAQPAPDPIKPTAPTPAPAASNGVKPRA